MEVINIEKTGMVKQPVSQFDDSEGFWYIHKPIGISGYELTRALPENLISSLPSIEGLEAEPGGMELNTREAETIFAELKRKAALVKWHNTRRKVR